MIKEKLGQAQEVALAVDDWSGLTQDGFTGVTAHWLEGVEIRSVTIAFRFAPRPHSAEKMSDFLVKVVEDFGLVSRIVSVTTDNATMMVSAIDKLKQKLRLKGATQDIEHIRCAAHIINLVVQEGAKKISMLRSKVRMVVSKILYQGNARTRFEEEGCGIKKSNGVGGLYLKKPPQ